MNNAMRPFANKLICCGILIFVSFCIGAAYTNKAQEGDKMGLSIKYFRDPRTDLCYAGFPIKIPKIVKLENKNNWVFIGQIPEYEYEIVGYSIINIPKELVKNDLLNPVPTPEKE